jgi:hypothetical protein
MSAHWRWVTNPETLARMDADERRWDELVAKFSADPALAEQYAQCAAAMRAVSLSIGSGDSRGERLGLAAEGLDLLVDDLRAETLEAAA